MSYNPSTDFVGLWRAVSGGVQKSEMPGMDFVVSALARAGIIRAVISQTPPTTNQTTTAWFKPANPSFGAEGALFLWDVGSSSYLPATPELFHGADTSGGGGGGGGGTGVIISPTPPANPANGQQWWDGTAMHVWDGTSWKLVGAGGAAATTTGVFDLVQSTTLTIPPSTGSTFSMTPWSNTPVVDIMGGFNASTKKWTPTKPGVYMVFIVGYGLVGSNAYAQTVLKNDVGSYDFTTPTQTVCLFDEVASSGGGIFNAVGICNMNGTTDYLRHWTFSGNGQIYVPPGSQPAWAVYAMP